MVRPSAPACRLYLRATERGPAVRRRCAVTGRRARLGRIGLRDPSAGDRQSRPPWRSAGPALPRPAQDRQHPGAAHGGERAGPVPDTTKPHTPMSVWPLVLGAGLQSISFWRWDYPAQPGRSHPTGRQFAMSV
jgi:hypothetical protein